MRSHNRFTKLGCRETKTEKKRKKLDEIQKKKSESNTPHRWVFFTYKKFKASRNTIISKLDPTRVRDLPIGSCSPSKLGPPLQWMKYNIR
jgi:hypothetical protein